MKIVQIIMFQFNVNNCWSKYQSRRLIDWLTCISLMHLIKYQSRNYIMNNMTKVYIIIIILLKLVEIDLLIFILLLKLQMINILKSFYYISFFCLFYWYFLKISCSLFININFKEKLFLILLVNNSKHFIWKVVNVLWFFILNC